MEDGARGEAGTPPPSHDHARDDGIDVRVYASPAALSDAGATLVANSLADAIATRGRAVLSLAGGTTPRALYQRLADAHRDDVAWERVVIAFGDERCVPPSSADSNFRMVSDALLDHVPLRREHVHRVHGELPPDRAAEDYDRVVRTLAGGGDTHDGPAYSLVDPIFDVTILGVGADGHTASLIPGSAALDERDRWAVAVSAPTSVPGPSSRVTLTIPVLHASRMVIFLATGASKMDAVRASLVGGTPIARRTPAGRVRGMERTLWLLDQVAAGEELIAMLD